jgi:hypothetical protein
MKVSLKSPHLVLAIVVSTAFATHAQIARWTFETSQPLANQGAGTWYTNIAPEIGSGSAAGFHAGPSIYTTPAGNGSPHSFSSTNWAVGDFYQFATSTVGYANIMVTYDQVSSSTGPGKFDFAYSTDGNIFTTIASSYTVLANSSPNAWSSGTAITTTSYTYDLSAITALNNASTVWFRIIDSSTTSANGGTIATGGTDRVDNFSIAVVPEPSTVALLGFGTLLLLRRFRR